MTSRAKRHKVSTPGTIGDLPSYDFTLEEKKNLLHAFKNNGFNLTYQMDSLLEVLPGRTSHEISIFIQTYKQRAKRKQQNQINSTSVDASSPSTSTSASSLAGANRLKDSPLSQWSHYIGQKMPYRDKREDLSEALIETLEKYSEQCSSEAGNGTEGTQNYSSIYQFLADCLRGKCPRELNAENSLIILTLLKQAKFLLNYVGCDSERKFIQNLSKENSVTRKKTTDNNEDEIVTGEKESQCLERKEDGRKDDKVVNNLFEKDIPCSTGNFVDLPSVASSIECHGPNDLLSQSTIQRRLNQFVEICMDLPKVKKIKSCLNPLNVPISMALEEANGLLDAIEDAS